MDERQTIGKNAGGDVIGPAPKGIMGIAMKQMFSVRPVLLHAFAIALLVPGACGTMRPVRFDPATAAVLLAFLVATTLAMPVLAARRKPATNGPCTVQATGTT